MSITIKARYTNGTLKPLVDLGLKEGQEVDITVESQFSSAVVREAADNSGEGLKQSFGGWVGIVDCEELKRLLYEARESGSRSNADYPEL